MPRILLLITDLEIGGTPTVVRELAVRLNRTAGAHVEVACLAGWGPVADQLRAAGVVVHALDARGVLDGVRTVARLVKLTRERRFDVVFSFLVHANVVAAVASTRLPDVRFLQSIQTTQPDPRWHWVAQGMAAHGAERVVVPSESVARAAAEWAGVGRGQGGQVVVIPNAVDAGAWPRAALAAPAGGPWRVGFVGRLDPVKRVPLLVRAMAKLDAAYHLHVYGDGPDRRAVERAVDDAGVRGRVTLHGAVTDAREAMAGLHALVLPSLAEGFGLVLIEAMAAGVPVVAADVPGIRDVVRHGENGLLIDPKEPGALAAAIVTATHDARDALVAKGLAEVRERYAWDVVLPQYQRVLGIG